MLRWDISSKLQYGRMKNENGFSCKNATKFVKVLPRTLAIAMLLQLLVAVCCVYCYQNIGNHPLTLGT